MPHTILRVVNLASRLAIIVGAVALVALVAAPDSPRAAPAAATASPGAIANLQRTVQTLQTRVRRLDKQVKALRIKKGPAGPAGAAGPAGPGGPAGPAGANGRALGFVHVTMGAGNAIALTHSSAGVTVTRTNTGTYCVTIPGVDSRQRPASAGLLVNPNGGSYLAVQVTINSSDVNAAACSAGSYVVATFAIKPTAVGSVWDYEYANYAPFYVIVA